MDISSDTYDFYAPTRIYYRPKGLEEIGRILKDDYGFSKVVLLYGGNSLKRSGAYDRIVSSLKEHQIDFLEFGGVKVNPDVENVVEIIAKAREFHPDLILGAGGGSVLDTAKSVANGYFYLGNPLDFNRHVVQPIHALPVGTILTLAASGSEMSDSCVISDRKHHFKGGFNSPTNRPLFSLLDPTLTYSVPPVETAYGLVDMFSHSFERFYSPSHDIEPADDLALTVMRDIVQLSPVVMKDPESYEARRAMMLLGTLSHNGITSFGKPFFFFKVHAAEHVLSGAEPALAHGQGIALLLPRYLEVNRDFLKTKILRMGREVFGTVTTEDPSDSILALKGWLKTFPIAHSFDELRPSIDPAVLQKSLKYLEWKK